MIDSSENNMTEIIMGNEKYYKLAEYEKKYGEGSWLSLNRTIIHSIGINENNVLLGECGIFPIRMFLKNSLGYKILININGSLSSNPILELFIYEDQVIIHYNGIQIWNNNGLCIIPPSKYRDTYINIFETCYQDYKKYQTIKSLSSNRLIQTIETPSNI